MEAWNGKFDLINPELIVVDHRYQRPEKETLIQAIAANPDWAAFGALSLYERGDGFYVCVDGQQRLRGVLTCDQPPKKVPCVIQAKADVKREATVFSAINITRRSVEAMEKHEALVTAGNPTALAIARVAEKTGFTIEIQSKEAQAHTIQAIAALYAIYRKLGEEGLLQVLVQARDSWPKDHLGVSAHLLRGVAQVLLELGEGYNRAKVTTSLSKSSPSIILKKSEELRYDFGGSKQRNVRRAIKELCKV